MLGAGNVPRLALIPTETLLKETEMMTALIHTSAVALRILALSAMMIAPVGALAWSNAGSLGIEKQGAGLVLFVTLQRQSMS
jgi:hypothetical protein